MVQIDQGNVSNYTGPTANLEVDGLDEEGSFAGDGQRAPFVVFDVDRQKNIAGPFIAREQAEQHRLEILAGHAPRLNAATLSKLLDEVDGNLDDRKTTHMSPAWSDAHRAAAHLEGWDIWDSCGSENGPWQIQHFDEASDIPEAIQLDSDDDALRIVVNGSEPHHEAARRFIRAHNPIEWAALEQTIQKMGNAASANSVLVPHWRCCNCMEPSPHPDNGCVLHAFVTVLRERETHSDSQLENLYISCNVDRLWDHLGGIIDGLGNGRYLDDGQRLNAGM